jgi:NAD+ diphosphatase
MRTTVGLAYGSDLDLFLGRVAQAPVFVRMAEAPGQQPLRRVLAQTGEVETELVMRATALVQYHADNGYCPRCGGVTTVADLGRTRWCPCCEQTHFPRLDPAIIVAIIDDRDRLLLGHHVGWDERRESVFAGFSEVGESLEQTVRREVHEEIGLRVDDIRYFGSQPWPMPRSLMVGFTAHTVGATPHPDGEEITSAHWYSRADLRAGVESGQIILPPAGSIAQRMVGQWLGAAG